MSFSVDIRSVDELFDDPDDPIRAVVKRAYGKPLSGTRNRETFYQFSYQALPPERIKLVIGELGDDDPVGLLVDDVPEPDPNDSFAPNFFSVPALARELAEKYPELLKHTLEDVYRGYETGEFSDEQVFASVLLDFARDPPFGYPVVVFGW